MNEVGHDEKAVDIVRPRRAIALPAAVASEPGRVPTVKVRSSSATRTKTAAKRKRAQSADAGGSGVSEAKSKKKSAEDQFDAYKKESDENRRKRKEDPEIPKILNPFQRKYLLQHGYEEAARTGSYDSPLPDDFKKPVSSEESKSKKKAIKTLNAKDKKKTERVSEASGASTSSSSRTRPPGIGRGIFKVPVKPPIQQRLGRIQPPESSGFRAPARRLFPQSRGTIQDRLGGFPRGGFPRDQSPRGQFPKGGFSRLQSPGGQFPRGGFSRAQTSRSRSPRGQFPRGQASRSQSPRDQSPSVWDRLGSMQAPAASSSRTVRQPSTVRDRSRDESSGGSNESRREVRSEVRSEVHVSGGVEHRSRRETTRTEERTSRQMGIRARQNARGMMAAHRISPQESRSRSTTSVQRVVPQRGHRIGRGFARAPRNYGQWEGFEPDEETEEEERDRGRHGQLRRDHHSNI